MPKFNTNDIKLLSEFNRSKVESVKCLNVNQRRKVIKQIRKLNVLEEKNNKFEEKNYIVTNPGINLEHFCLGQTLFFLTS